jgi:hypothetical protein
MGYKANKEMDSEPLQFWLNMDGSLMEFDSTYEIVWSHSIQATEIFFHRHHILMLKHNEACKRTPIIILHT